MTKPQKKEKKKTPTKNRGTWRLVQSPTSTAYLQTQSLFIAAHPPILMLEDQLKLHIASTSQW